MTEHKKYQIQDLIEKIKRVDRMIKIHSTNPSKVMMEQYQAKKEKLFGYLIDELIQAKVRSPYSFKLIQIAIKKFYPELQVKTATKSRSKNPEIKKLIEIEKALVA